MASICAYTAADGSTTFKVQIRIKGYPPQFVTFDRKTDAKRWANDTEAALRAGRYIKTNEARRKTFSELCDRYIDHVLPTKSTSHQRDQHQLLAWWKSRIGSYILSDLTSALIAEQRDYLAKHGRRFASAGRDKPIAAATLTRYLATISVMFSCAVKEWGWMDTNPVINVRKPRESNARVRFLSDDERTRLLNACSQSKNRYLYLVVLMAISTGARNSGN